MIGKRHKFWGGDEIQSKTVELLCCVCIYARDVKTRSCSPRPRHSKIFLRPRRDWDIWFWVRERDVQNPDHIFSRRYIQVTVCFLLCCVECSCGLATRILPVCPSVCCKVFIGLTIRAKMIGGGRPLLPEILGQTDRVGAKSPIFDLFSPTASKP